MNVRFLGSFLLRLLDLDCEVLCDPLLLLLLLQLGSLFRQRILACEHHQRSHQMLLF